jgi:hypothetical protein
MLRTHIPAEAISNIAEMIVRNLSFRRFIVGYGNTVPKPAASRQHWRYTGQ